MRFKILLAGVLLGLLSLCEVKAQDAAVKTNILSDIVLSPSVSAEVGLAPNGLRTDRAAQRMGCQRALLETLARNARRALLVLPQILRSFCRRSHLRRAIQLRKPRQQHQVSGLISRNSPTSAIRDGCSAQAWPTVTHRIIDRRWNIEAEIGLRWVHTPTMSIRAPNAAQKASGKHHNYFGPIKAAINLIYTF